MSDSPSNETRHSGDEWIVVRCQLGERPAFDELIARWHEPLWKYARRLTGSNEAANEAVQDVWLRVLRGISRLREASKLRPWLFGIARRVLMDRLRAEYAAPVTTSVDEQDIPAAETALGPDDDLDLLHAELGRLPTIERDVLTLFYLQELSLAEIADVTSVPLGTVKSRLFRARVSLKREIEDRRPRP